MTNTSDQVRAEANRLYWETELSVADVAQQLGLSRRGLYEAVQPLPAEGRCGVCDSELVFENRSARSSGNAVCIVCPVQEEDYDNGAGVRAAPQSGTGSATASAPEARAGDHPGLVVGAALAGAAFGALLTLAVVPRR